MTKTNKIGLYIHIPFCMKKCRYCDFLSFPCSEVSILGEYASALVREIKTRYEEWPYRVVDTVFIGGGTPSLMHEKDMARVINAVKDNFTLTDDCEITIEANPATLTDAKLEAYIECGINRISIGVQSFDNAILNLLGRAHDKNEGINAIMMAKRAGFKNINVDLMFGIPAQTTKMWRDSLRQCLFLQPQHISFYSLQIEENTPFYKMIVEDKIVEPLSERTDRIMYHDAAMMLEDAGYRIYEISNAAIPGFESRHNMKYWSYEEYLGLGLGASSFIGGHRFRNCTRMQDYLKFIKSSLPPVFKEDVEEYSRREEMGIYMFTGLRRYEGVNLDAFESEFGADFFKIYDPSLLEKYKGYLEVSHGCLRLTEKGVDISNRIMAEFV